MVRWQMADEVVIFESESKFLNSALINVEL